MTTDTTEFKTISKRQALFIRYVTAILIDLTVLNLFNEYWSYVHISSFTISLLAAIVLQLMLQITFKIEHRIGSYLSTKGKKWLRLLTAWALLFGSKLAILWILGFLFGDKIMFKGPFHGVVAFVLVIMAMLATEALMRWITIIALGEKKEA